MRILDDASGEVLERATIPTHGESFEQYFARHEPMLVPLDVETRALAHDDVGGLDTAPNAWLTPWKVVAGARRDRESETMRAFSRTLLLPTALWLATTHVHC